MEEKKDLMKILKSHKKEIEALVPKYINKDRMLSIFLEAVNNPKIQNCTPVSVLKCAKKMAEMGTDRVGGGGVWLVPFKNELTVIPDWRLIVEKACKSKVIKRASAKIVHENDTFEYEYGLNPQLIHKPNLKEPGKCIATYCIITFPDNSKDFTVMNLEEIEAIKKRSKASFGPWVTDFEQMAVKTVVKRALKIFEGASPELTKVLDLDNTSTGFVDITSSEPIKEPEAIKEPEVIDVTPPEEKEKIAKDKEKIVKKENPKVKILTEEEIAEVKPRGKDADIHPVTEAQLKALKKITTKLGLDEKGISKFIKEFFEDAEIGTLESLTSTKAAELINELQ